ncbi:MAG: cobalt-precorrin-6A reductase [Stappiaceae bacterium]
MSVKRVLLLAGTGEARRLAMCLADRSDLDIVASLAGAVSKPAVLPVKTRIGGFGGVDGLIRYLKDHKVDALIDATHPFSVQMKHHVDLAITETNIPVVHLIRPAWVAEAGDKWLNVGSLKQAAEVLPSGSRPFLSVGRREIGIFADKQNISPVARMIDPPIEGVLDQPITIILSHPQSDWRAEKELFLKHEITHLVTKNSGGEQSHAKLVAARALKVPVIMIDRPPLPAAPTLETVEATETWLHSVLDR